MVSGVSRSASDSTASDSIGLVHSLRACDDDGRRGGACGTFCDLAFQLRAVSLKLLVCQIGYRIFVRNLDLLRHERREDAGVGRRIFVADLLERVEPKRVEGLGLGFAIPRQIITIPGRSLQKL
jgi:hypothetical protein